MLIRKHYSSLLLILGLLVPVAGIAIQPDHVRQHIEDLSRPDVIVSFTDFKICFQYGCKQIQNVSLSREDWDSLIARWDSNNIDAASERILIAEYIAQLELIIGRITNTRFDVGGSFSRYFTLKEIKSEQMDCIDESTNTLTYLRMLEGQNKLKWHSIEGLISRGGLLAGYPHTAVLIKDKKSGENFVVDSWFYDNGRPPVILAKKRWKLGWSPE